MAFIYCKYRVDFDNTVTGLSPAPQSLDFNEQEVYTYSGMTYGGDVHNYRFDGIQIIANTPTMINSYKNYLIINDNFYGSYIASGYTSGLTQNIADSTNTISKKALITGLYHGGRLSINANNTKFDIMSGYGYVKDSYNVDTPITKYIYWNNLTGITPTFLLTKPVTHVSISSGGTIIQRESEPTLLEIKKEIYLGVVVHTQNTTISSTATRPMIGKNIGLQFNDYITAFGLLNIGIDSNKISGHTGMTFTRKSGALLGRGINYDNDERIPHTISVDGSTIVSFRYRTIGGSNGSQLTNIDPTTFEQSADNVITITGDSNCATTQRVYMFPSTGIAIQRGQKVYKSIIEAYVNLSYERVIINNDINSDAILIGAIIVRKGATDLTNPMDAVFVDADSFGNLADTIDRNIYNKMIGNIITFTGTTAPATYQTRASINVLTGTTLPNQYASKSAFLIFTANTSTDFETIEGHLGYLSGQTAGKLNTSSFNVYSASTLTNINSRALKTVFNGYTGTTAPATYQTKTSITIYTGTTAPAQFVNKSNFNTYSGTTVPATYLTKSSFNTYSGLTLTNINTRLVTSSFNTYSGNTAVLINTKIGSANNGLTKSGTNVRLGGIMTGATTIGLGTNSITFTGTTGTLRYGSDLSAQYTPRSVVDKGYVTGITSTLATKTSINIYTGTTAPATYQTKASITIYTGTTAPATYLTKSAFNTYSGLTLTNINSKASSANNGLTLSGTNVRLGGSLTGATTITSPATGSRLSFAGFPIQYSTDVSANYNPRSLVDKGYVTGTTQAAITFRENGTNLNTVPIEFTVINFTSGITAIDKGSNVLEVRSIFGSEVFETGRTTTATNSTATFTDYLAKGFVLAGGTYKVEYVCKASIATANSNLGIQMLIDGAALEAGTNNLYRISNVSARVMVSAFKVIALSAGSHSFRVQHSASTGTATAEYGWILITRIS